MRESEIIKIIKEELNAYDYLGNDAYNKEEENINLIKNEDFQKQFILDSILKKKEKIKENVTDARISNQWEERDSGTISLEYFTDITYTYDPTKPPIKFTLDFSGDEIGFDKGSDYDAGNMYDIAPSGGDWFDGIEWGDINAQIFVDGDEIPFIAFQKAGTKIQNIFVREYVEGTIERQSGLEIKEPKERM